MKTAYILDFDGTLAESYASLVSAVRHAQGRMEAVKAAGGDTRADLARIQAQWPLTADGPTDDPVLAKYRAEIIAAADLVPELHETAYRLYEKGVRLALVSCNRIKMMDALLHTLGMFNFFEAIYGPDSIGQTALHADLIHQAIDNLRVRREEVLFVGDTTPDIDIARAAGVHVALVVGACTRSVCASGAPDVVLATWTQLLGVRL